ncbi:MAG: 16S rRNA (cytidine(1402)-2'-O)-methyltransferase [Actinomycetia bacterium]|nr:16S rRNA (cytidine(1402)-2'-O)-methyltransferase [Actinomycetes bacterium]
MSGHKANMSIPDAAASDQKTGKLSVCATPIGNLGDITARVREALQAADVVLAEDTRMARKLLSCLGAQVKVERCDENVIRLRTAGIVERIAAGEHLALVSDAGTPAVSDPGAVLVAAVRAAGLQVEVLPGASAVLTALVASGFECSAFYFGGFLPRREKDQQIILAQLASLDAVLIFYESPYRLLASLRVLADMFGERQICLARELTKMHEEVIVASAVEVLQQAEDRLGADAGGSPLKGEIVLLIDAPLKKSGQRVHKDKYAPGMRNVRDND